MNVVPIAPETACPPTFDDFWLLVVKRVGKYETRQEWVKLTEADQMAAVIGAAAWRPSWIKMDGHYILHPCRWVKYHRWEDELPAEVRESSASHMPAQIPARGERTQMPDDVRALLAKLRAK